MAYERKDGDGELFRNDYKQSDKHPDYKGALLLNGVEYKVAAWIRAKKDGGKWLSLSVKRKTESTFQPKGHSAETRATSSGDGFSDEIPF